MSGERTTESIMTSTGVHAFDPALDSANIWLKAVMSRLKTEDERVGVTALRATLHALRDRIGLNNAAHLGAQLPTLLRGIYYEGWQPSRRPSRERHKEAFLEHLRKDSPQTVPFDAEAAARAVFDVMWEKVDPGEVVKLIRVLPAELRELWPGIAQVEAAEEEEAQRRAPSATSSG
jgi:uncharacterized protein (DUF2267 family)